MHQFVHDYQLVSTTTPNTPPEVTSKDFLETSINQGAPFASGFLGINLDFLKSQNAPFLARFLGLINYELIRNSLNPRGVYSHIEACQWTSHTSRKFRCRPRYFHQ